MYNIMLRYVSKKSPTYQRVNRSHLEQTAYRQRTRESWTHRIMSEVGEVILPLVDKNLLFQGRSIGKLRLRVNITISIGFCLTMAWLAVR